MNPDHSFRLCEFFLTWLAEDRFHVLQELTFTEATQVRPAGCWLIAANSRASDVGGDYDCITCRRRKAGVRADLAHIQKVLGCV